MKLSDLDHLDQPVGSDGQDPLAIQRSEAFRFINHCKALELDPKFVWAYDTIAGIRGMVETTGRVSDGQRRAIQNIEVGQERRQSGREDRDRYRFHTRRYDGFDGNR